MVVGHEGVWVVLGFLGKWGREREREREREGGREGGREQVKQRLPCLSFGTFLRFINPCLNFPKLLKLIIYSSDLFKKPFLLDIYVSHFAFVLRHTLFFVS
jgi:hypothetical protein